jgi:hypothetical protein
MNRSRLVAFSIAAGSIASQAGSAQSAPTQTCGPFHDSSNTRQGGGSARALGDGVRASLVYSRVGGRAYGFVVVTRGLASNSSGGGSSVGGDSRQTHGTIRMRPGRTVAEYDIGPDSEVVRIGGVRVDLRRDGNVVLADFMADRNQPSAVSMAGCVDITDKGALTTVGSMARVKELVGPGGRTNQRAFRFADLVTSGRLMGALAILALVLVVARRWGRGTPSHEQASKAPRVAFGLALALAIVTAVAFLPLVLDDGDVRPLLALMFPVALAAFPLAVRPGRARALTCAAMGILMMGFCFIAGFSIGLFFVPTALMLLIAALVGLVRARRGGDPRAPHSADPLRAIGLE